MRVEENWLVTFDRIGRDHNPPPLTVTVKYDPDTEYASLSDSRRPEQQIAIAVWECVMGKRPADDGSKRKRVNSQDVSVGVEPEEGRGSIACGWHSGGTFTVEPV